MNERNLNFRLVSLQRQDKNSAQSKLKILDRFSHAYQTQDKIQTSYFHSIMVFNSIELNNALLYLIHSKLFLDYNWISIR